MNEYDLAIKELKEKYPEYKDCRFELCDGELSYWDSSYHGSIDMVKMQKEINEILGQKPYQADLMQHEECYARSESEAKEFINRIKPEGTYIDKIYETSEY